MHAIDISYKLNILAPWQWLVVHIIIDVIMKTKQLSNGDDRPSNNDKKHACQ